MSITSEQWLELHKRALETVRASIRGLDQEKLLWKEPRSQKSIASEVAHICGAEAYWLREASIAPRFATPSQNTWSVQVFQDVLDRIQKRYHEVLAERADDADILFGLGRVCQHALYHLPRIIHFRIMQEPDWIRPEPGRPGTWEHAVDYLSDLLIHAQTVPDTPTGGLVTPPERTNPPGGH